MIERREPSLVQPLTKPYRPTVVIDEPTEQHKTPYTVLTPIREFSGVVMKRQFINGRTIVYDPEIVRQFVQDYGYRCEPDLPPPAKPSHAKRSGKAKRGLSGATFTEGALG